MPGSPSHSFKEVTSSVLTSGTIKKRIILNNKFINVQEVKKEKPKHSMTISDTKSRNFSHEFSLRRHHVIQIAMIP